MLRQWRNDPKIQQYMFYRETITPEMQEKWFQKINNDHNFYFIIEYEGKEIGCVNIKDVDYEKKCGETGIYLYDSNFEHRGVACKSYMSLIEFCFKSLCLKFLIAHVLLDNESSINFHIKIGYIQFEKSKDTYGKYVLTQEAYNRAKRVLDGCHFFKKGGLYNLLM